MAIDTNFPTWMLPRESPIDAIAKGIQMGTALAQTRQAGQRLALAAQEQQQRMELENKKFELDSQSQGLRNQLLSEQVTATQADLPKMQDFMSRLTHAENVDQVVATQIPSFRDPSNYHQASQAQFEKMKVISSTELNQARATSQAAINKRAAETILEVPEAQEFIFRGGKMDMESLTKWSAIADQQKQAKSVALKQATMVTGAPDIVDVGGVKYVRNPKTGALHLVPKDAESLDLIPMHDDSGNVMGYGYKNSRGGISPWKSETRHPLETPLARAKAKLAAAKAKGMDDDAKGLEAEVNSLEESMRPGERKQTVDKDPLGLFP